MSDPAKVDVLRRVTDAFNRTTSTRSMGDFSDECVFESPRS